MANPAPNNSGSGGQAGGGGVAASSFSNANQSNTSTDNSNTTASAQTAYAPVISDQSGDVTYNGSDYGAIAAATATFGNALNLAQSVTHDSQITSRMLSSQAQDTVASQGAEALNLITKPFLWVAAIVAVTVAFLYWVSSKKGKSHAS